MRVMNLMAAQNDAGQKVLHLNIFGVIAQGWSDTVDASVIAQQLAENRDAVEIVQHINSIGGDMFDGIAIHNLVRGHGARVTSIVEGMAASAASIVAMAGKTIMASGAMMMIHNPWTLAVGDAKELRRVAADLDKSRESLVAIYKAKTGKDGAELRALLDAETLMTAEQAKRNGFADEIAADTPATVEAKGDLLFVNSVAFQRDHLPTGVLNMLNPTPPAPVAPANATPPAPPVVPVQAAAEPITREILASKAPEVLAALIKEGHAAGAAAERTRLQAIDELPIRGHSKLFFEAKYGAEPKTAEQVALAAWKAEQDIAASRIEAARIESKDAAGVRQSAPEKTTEAEENEAAKNIAEHANRRHGRVK